MSWYGTCPIFPRMSLQGCPRSHGRSRPHRYRRQWTSVRFLTLLQDGRLLTKSGVAFLTVSSNGLEMRQRPSLGSGLAGRTVATRTFDDGETLRVLAVWKPYSNASIERVESTLSTNDDVMNRGGPRVIRFWLPSKRAEGVVSGGDGKHNLAP